MVCWPDLCFERRCGGARLQSPSRSTLIPWQQSPPARAEGQQPHQFDSTRICLTGPWTPAVTADVFPWPGVAWCLHAHVMASKPPPCSGLPEEGPAAVCRLLRPAPEALHRPATPRRCPGCPAVCQSLGEARLHPISWSCAFRWSDQFACSFSDHLPRVFLSVYCVRGTVPNA